MTTSDPQRRDVDRRTALEVCDESAEALYGLANLLCGDPEVAEDAVVEVITAAVRASDVSLQRPDLARQIYDKFPGLPPRRGDGEATMSPLSHTEKVALGLAISGARDYRWVARVMGISPELVLQALRSALTCERPGPSPLHLRGGEADCGDD